MTPGKTRQHCYKGLANLTAQLNTAINHREAHPEEDNSQKRLAAQRTILDIIGKIRKEAAYLYGLDSSDPKIPGLRDALNRIPKGRAPASDVGELAAQLQGITAELPQTAQTPKMGKRRLLRSDETLRTIRVLVRQMHEEKKTYAEICNNLGNHARPPRAEWRHLTWIKAYKDPQYHSAVKTWIAKAVADSKLP